MVKKVVHLRTTRGWGPARIGPELDLPVSTDALATVKALGAEEKGRYLTAMTSSPQAGGAPSEILGDEKGSSTAAFRAGANAWFTGCGITLARCLSDNGANYRSRDFAAALAATATVHKRTRPHRPQTNGEIERFHRTLATEWAYARPYGSEAARRRALPKWLHLYNHHRHHTALGGLPPACCVTNLTGQYS